MAIEQTRRRLSGGSHHYASKASVFKRMFEPFSSSFNVMARLPKLSADILHQYIPGEKLDVIVVMVGFKFSLRGWTWAIDIVYLFVQAIAENERVR